MRQPIGLRADDAAVDHVREEIGPRQDLLAGGLQIVGGDQLADGQVLAGEAGLDAVDQAHQVQSLRRFGRAQHRPDRAHQAGDFAAAVAVVDASDDLGANREGQDDGGIVIFG